MKQVININFQGRVVPIEVTAFDNLKQYTDSLNRYFANEEGKDEIINDIENRIGELFQERLQAGATCITDDDVNAIIRSMGRPEDFESQDATAERAESNYQSGPENFSSSTSRRLFRDENNKVIGGVCSGLANYFKIDVVVVRVIFVILAVFGGVGLIPYLILWVAVPSSASKVVGGVRKKLYRDMDDKFIGGVCSGIANYFGINVWIPRVMFLLPFLGFVSRWGNIDFSHFLRLGFSPGSLIVYIILWLVIPEAASTAEKLEMKGEKVDMNSIKNSVMEEMKGVQQRAEKFGREAGTIAAERSKAFSSEVNQISRRSGRSLGDVIVFLFKAFAYFILGIFGIAIIVALFALAIFSIGIFPMKDFLLTQGWQSALAWGTLIFFIATPIIGIITWLVRRLAKVKTNRKMMRISFTGLWVLGWACFIFLIASVSRDFTAINNLNEQEIPLIDSGMNKLEITADAPYKNYYRNRWFRMEPFEGFDEDTAYVRNVSVHILKSPNDQYRVTMLKMVNGRTKRYADTLADIMNYNIAQHDSLLLVDRGIAINKKDKFRNQRVVITVYVPVGKQIKVDKSVGWGHNVRFSGPWNNNDDWNIEFEGLEEGWDEGVDYIMQADGLYTLDGKPANTWKHPRKNRDYNADDADLDNYRFDSSSSNTLKTIDSLKQKMKSEQKKTKDSLEKVKEKIEKQLEKIDDNVENGTAYNQVLSGYNMMLMIN